MIELEEKIKKRKKEDFITLIIGCIFLIIFALQLYRAYLEVGVLNFDSILLNFEYNIKNKFFFVPTKEYKVIFLLISMFFLIKSLDILSNNKKYMRGEEYGSSRWATSKEKQKYKDRKEQKNLILAEDIRLSLNGRKIKKNANVCVVGASGTGKSRYVVKPNLMQLNTSYVITDPKGELFKETGKMFLNHKYKVKVFNLKDISETMKYNPFKYFYKIEDIFSFIKMLIENTDNGAKGNDPFWEKAETLLLQAVMIYLYEERPKHEQTLPNVIKLLRTAKIAEDEEKGAVNPLDIIFSDLEKEKGETFAVKQYKDFKSGSGKTLKTVLMCALTRLAFVDIPTIENMLSDDELEIEKLGQEKTALFVIIPDNESSFNFLVSILYNQMFKVLVNIADKKTLKIPIQYVLDEIANIGQIPNFEKVMGTIRSRKMSAMIFLQSISQLENMYKNTWKSIVDNCNSTLFLGGDESAEWMSKKLGKRTIDSTTTNQSRGRNRSTSENNMILGRELMTAEEITRMPDEDCICKIRGSYPMYSRKYDITKHPLYSELGDAFDPENKNNFNFQDLIIAQKRNMKTNAEELAENLEKMKEMLEESGV